MNKVVNIIRWICSNILHITVVLLGFLYIWWFRLNPLVFGAYQHDTQASYTFIFGVVLLIIYGSIVGMSNFSRDVPSLRRRATPAILFLVANILFVYVSLPRLKASAHFENTTYYITSNLAILVCCQYHQFTQWQGILRYESFFIDGFVPKLRFIYDQGANELYLVDVSENTERLYMTKGKEHRYYHSYANLENHLYYISGECLPKEIELCATLARYAIYRCELDNTHCTKLPIEYTGGISFTGLKANEMTGNIEFYLVSYLTGDGMLIFTYGEHTECFVEGCVILEQ